MTPAPDPTQRNRPRTGLARARRVALMVTLAVALTQVGWLGTPAVVAAWDDGAPSAESERELTALTNRSRSSAGLRPLTVDAELVELARWRSRDMAERDDFSHDIPGVGKVFDVLDERSFCYELAGENIGWAGGADDGAETRIQAMFLDSPTHRANVLGEAWDAVGIGSYRRADGRKFWTVLFADRCGPAAALPEPAPEPAAEPQPGTEPEPRPGAEPEPRTPAPAPTADPAPTAAPPPTTAPATPAADLRVVEPAPTTGLLDTLIGEIAGSFLGD